jgi:hypothetical protein
MAKLYWLKSLQPCKLELRPLTDYAGQPLVFTNPGTSYGRRCVTEEVRMSTLVDRYLRQQVIADEDTKIELPPAAPVVVIPAPEPIKVATPVAVPENIPAPESAEIVDAPVAIENVEKTEAAETVEPSKNFSSRDSKRGRGR